MLRTNILASAAAIAFGATGHTGPVGHSGVRTPAKRPKRTIITRRVERTRDGFALVTTTRVLELRPTKGWKPMPATRTTEVKKTDRFPREWMTLKAFEQIG